MSPRRLTLGSPLCIAQRWRVIFAWIAWCGLSLCQRIDSFPSRCMRQCIQCPTVSVKNRRLIAQWTDVLQRLQESLQARFTHVLSTCTSTYGEVTIEVETESYLEVCHALRDEPRFSF